MQTTVRVDEDVARFLEKIKEQENLPSHSAVIRKLLEQKKLSMFGTEKKLRPWNEREDRAADRSP